MLEMLRNHLRGTSLDVLRAEWEEIEALDLHSPNAYAYIEYAKTAHTVTRQRCEVDNVFPEEKMTSNFSGSIFLYNIAL